MLKEQRGRRGVIRVLGVMTGTSCDGLDAACLDINGAGWKVLWEKSCPYPKPLRSRVIAIQKPGGVLPLRSVLELNRDLGSWYGATLAKLIQNTKPSERPDVISNHGQTVGHFPGPLKSGVTLQVGDPTRIAQATGLTVVSSFREGDMAAGGQGAPLVPLYHKMLAHHLGNGQGGIAIHNIGGISNLTYIHENGEILAFDTGPGNIWIDAAAEKVSHGKERMDINGKRAAKGLIDLTILNTLLRHPYFKQRPPKSTGRDSFPIEFFFKATRSLRGADLVATATALTAESIAQAYERWVLQKGQPLHAVYLCGGGAQNPALVSCLRNRMPDVVFSTMHECELNPKYIEAQAFALFGFLGLTGIPLGGNWTGAKGFGPPAHIIPGKNWTKVAKTIAKML